MIDTEWSHRLIQSLEYAAGFELFLLLGPGSLAEPTLASLAVELARFGTPRWHAIDREGLDGLLGARETKVLHLVHGLEHLPAAAARGLVARLNVNRSQLREVGAPVLFWVPESFYEEFLRQAPDLVAWRSQVAVVAPRDVEAPVPTDSSKPSRVWISYSHESPEHSKRVLELAQRLRADGIDARLDQFTPAPAEGWTSWIIDEVARADLIVAVCTPGYRQRTEAGGQTWERLIRDELVRDDKISRGTVVPVVFSDAADEDVPILLRGISRYSLPADYDHLVLRLGGRGEGLTVPPTSDGMGDLPNLGDELAILREERERRVRSGEDTSHVDQAILDLRRCIRDRSALANGDIVAHRYALIEQVGSGGFATVWKAFDPQTRKVVAVKILHRQWNADRSAIERFKLAARTMARLGHGAIVPALDFGRDDSLHFLVMPWYAGGDLQRAITRGALERSLGLSACADAIEGIDHAHRQGIVHRDVKPSNILLDDQGRGYLGDFDLVMPADTTMGTRTGAGMGTFAYAAPEQLESAASVDARADVYSAAMCLLFVLLGKNPPAFVALTQPPVLEQLPCSDALREVIRGALAYDREQRTTTCLQLVAAVREFVTEKHVRIPAWAAEGVDAFGRWSCIRVGNVEQRMRWIAPGTFMMGSPESELGRFDNEGPRHRVTLSRGLWLADTPCTQALWVEVMGENPSQFESPQRPVEQVSWDDVQAFLHTLAARLSGVRPGLPTEAEWEYACRAGTTGPTYGRVDDVAWHWGNSGGTTHDAGQKLPNSWGLHDMLGNVWEWCADAPRMFGHETVVDPYGQASTRVCRGGSWGSDARFARAACRVEYPPSYRYGSVGFRLTWHAGP